MPFEQILCTAKALEEIRAQGARQSAELIRALEALHSGAHLFYGGVFNAIDFSILGGLTDSLFNLLNIEVGEGGSSRARDAGITERASRRALRGHALQLPFR